MDKEFYMSDKKAKKWESSWERKIGKSKSGILDVLSVLIGAAVYVFLFGTEKITNLNIFLLIVIMVAMFATGRYRWVNNEKMYQNYLKAKNKKEG